MVRKDARKIYDENNNESTDIDNNDFLKNNDNNEHNLLDTLLVTTLPNGDSIPDEIINEEINFVLFTVSVYVLNCFAERPLSLFGALSYARLHRI